MIIRPYVLALATLALAIALGAPAAADQTFWTYSTAPVPTPKPRATNPSINVDYVYYPCPQVAGSPGRFNPWDARGTSGATNGHMRPGTSNDAFGCSTGHHNRPQPRPTGRRVPLAKPT